MQEIFIRLKAGTAPNLEGLLKAIETAGGRALSVYPPHAILALLPPSAVEVVSQRDDVAAAWTEPISRQTIESAEEPLRTALQAWNEHLARRPRKPAAAAEGLSWDAPGRLPPDPPPEIQAEWRRREQRHKDAD
jgi:hypothetical protein